MERVLGRYAVMVWADGMHSYVMHQEVLCIITILMIATLLWIIEALFHSVEWTLPKSAKTKFSSVESRLQSENMKRNKKRNGSASHFFLHHKFFCIKSFFGITFFLHHKFFCIRSAQINTFLLKTNKNISTADGASFRGCWSKRTEWFETVVNSDMHACRQI